MGDLRVASPILRRPARFGLAASDRGYAGCELRRISLLRGWVNKATTVRCMGWLGLSQLLILLHIGNLSAPNVRRALFFLQCLLGGVVVALKVLF